MTEQCLYLLSTLPNGVCLDQNGNTTVGVCSITVLSLVSESGLNCVSQVIQTDSEPASESEIIEMTIRKGNFCLEGEN